MERKDTKVVKIGDRIIGGNDQYKDRGCKSNRRAD